MRTVRLGGGRYVRPPRRAPPLAPLLVGRAGAISAKMPSSPLTGVPPPPPPVEPDAPAGAAAAAPSAVCGASASWLASGLLLAVYLAEGGGRSGRDG